MFGIITGWKKHHLKKFPGKERSVCFVPGKKASTALLFVAKDDIMEEYVASLADFLHEQVELDIVYYVKSSKDIPNTFKDGEFYLSANDISVRGEIKKTVLDWLFVKDYDWLIDLSMKSDGVYDYILGQLNVQCKIGIKRPGRLYDIEFSVIENTADLKNRLIHLLFNVNAY